MKVDIPFLTNQVFDAHYPVNMYFHPEGWNGRPALIRTDGLKLWNNPGVAGEVRVIYRFNSTTMYAIVGNTVYRYVLGSPTSLGTISTSTGPVVMRDDGAHVVFIEGNKGWYITGTTLTEITDADFVTPQYLEYMDGFFLIIQKDSDYVWKSALRDPSSWDALDNTAAERFPDKALAMIQDHTELPVFGEKSTEFFYNSGNAVFPITRKPGYFIERGIGAAHSLVKLDESLFWLADDWTVRRMVEYTPVIISRPDLNRVIAGLSNKEDARAFGYAKDGNSFYVLSVGDRTFQFNAATKEWNELAYGPQLRRHRANCYCNYMDKHLVGDCGNGNIYELDSSTYTDNGEIIKRVRPVPPVFGPTGERLFFHELEIQFKPGVGLVDGVDPQSMLRWSDDGYRTFSNEHWEGVGKIGEYQDRSVWSMLGSSRERVYEWSATSPVDWVIVGIKANITQGIS